MKPVFEGLEINQRKAFHIDFPSPDGESHSELEVSASDSRTRGDERGCRRHNRYALAFQIGVRSVMGHDDGFAIPLISDIRTLAGDSPYHGSKISDRHRINHVWTEREAGGLDLSVRPDDLISCEIEDGVRSLDRGSVKRDSVEPHHFRIGVRASQVASGRAGGGTSSARSDGAPVSRAVRSVLIKKYQIADTQFSGEGRGE